MIVTKYSLLATRPVYRLHTHKNRRLKNRFIMQIWLIEVCFTELYLPWFHSHPHIPNQSNLPPANEAACTLDRIIPCPVLSPANKSSSINTKLCNNKVGGNVTELRRVWDITQIENNYAENYDKFSIEDYLPLRCVEGIVSD